MDLFTDAFIAAVKELISAHHKVYPDNPPRDIFFEYLIERAFKLSGVTDIQRTSAGRSREDMTVSGVKLSIKSQTGLNTSPNNIIITKLTTTENAQWDSEHLIARVLEHLKTYDKILMVRAIWQSDSFDYQLLDVPVALLKKMKGAQLALARGRGEKASKSLTVSVMDDDEKLFDVFFDATDRKCVIRNLPVSRCVTLDEWSQTR